MRFSRFMSLWVIGGLLASVSDAASINSTQVKDVGYPSAKFVRNLDPAGGEGYYLNCSNEGCVVRMVSSGISKSKNITRERADLIVNTFMAKAKAHLAKPRRGISASMRRREPTLFSWDVKGQQASEKGSVTQAEFIVGAGRPDSSWEAAIWLQDALQKEAYQEQ